MVQGIIILGRSGHWDLGFASFVVNGIYLLLAIFSYEKFQKSDKLERELDSKHQQERLKKQITSKSE